MFITVWEVGKWKNNTCPSCKLFAAHLGRENQPVWAGDMSLRGCWLPTTWLINMSHWNCTLPSIRHWILDPVAQFPSCVAQAHVWSSRSFCWRGITMISLCKVMRIPWHTESTVTCCMKCQDHHHFWQREQGNEAEFAGGHGWRFEPWRRSHVLRDLEWIPGGELTSRVCIRFRSCIFRSVQHPGVSHSVTCLPVAIAGTH